LLVDGLTNTEVAKSLNTSVHTVKAHRAEVMRRMQAYTFADLVGQLQRMRMSMKEDDIKHATTSRIIVVEDDLWYRSYLTENLNERSYLAIGVADGDEFTAAWLESPPDLVILDIELGLNKEDGFAIAARLFENSNCGVIIVTSHDEPDDRIKGLSIGVDAYFSKPVNINELVLTITNLLRRLR